VLTNLGNHATFRIDADASPGHKAHCLEEYERRPHAHRPRGRPTRRIKKTFAKKAAVQKCHGFRTLPNRPRLVVSRSTCPPISPPPPHVNSFVLGPAVINTHSQDYLFPLYSSSLTHTRRMDGFCNQNANQLSSLAGLSFPVVYVGVVECAPASPYTYSSSTHRFPDERTPIEATPLSATSVELVWVWVWVWDWVHIPPHTLLHTLLSFSPPSFHTISLSLAFTSA
jgi:hypothetical protein